MSLPAGVKSVKTIDGTTHYRPTGLSPEEKVGAPVRIRPCADNPEDKTYDGIYLGDFAVGFDIDYKEVEQTLYVGFDTTNPAIWVPELNRVVFGYESWWGMVRTEEDRTAPITDEGIENIPYVQVLKALAEEFPIEIKEPEEKPEYEILFRPLEVAVASWSVSGLRTVVEFWKKDMAYPVGQAWVTTAPNHVYVDWILVDEAHRRKGIGKKLLEAIRQKWPAATYDGATDAGKALIASFEESQLRVNTACPPTDSK